MTDLPEYTLDREFDAPRDLVWKAWTDPKLLSRWYGPGVETIIHNFDLKPGGSWLNEMKWGETSDYSKMLFTEVTPPERLVWHHCSTNKAWDIAQNQMMPDWPRVLLTTVTFEESDGKTTVRLRQVPVDATEVEIACFAKMMTGMDGGWGKGFAMIDEILAELSS